eukprot:14800734-Ditylum_brightwellii.AAC.1
MMNPNDVVVIDFGYGTSIIIHCFLVNALHKGTGQRLRATILLEGRDGDSVFYRIKWVEYLENVVEWEVVVPRRNVRRIVMM